MIAVDANVVLRIIVGDDDAQLATALRLFERGQIFLSLTALLETEWVLRSRYRYSRLETAAALTALLRLEGIVVDRPTQVQWAIDRHSLGADFADMIHVVGSGDARTFATFDRTIAKHAGKDPLVPIETLA